MSSSVVRKLVVAVAVVLAPSAAAARPNRKPPIFKPTVSSPDARKTALAKVPGVVKSEELEREDGRWIYSFIIKPDQGRKGFVKEVNVDATSGAIVAVETERESPRRRPAP